MSEENKGKSWGDVRGLLNNVEKLSKAFNKEKPEMMEAMKIVTQMEHNELLKEQNEILSDIRKYFLTKD